MLDPSVWQVELVESSQPTPACPDARVRPATPSGPRQTVSLQKKDQHMSVILDVWTHGEYDQGKWKADCDGIHDPFPSRSTC